MDRKGKKITTEKVDAIGRIGSQLLKVNTEANLRASERSPIRSATGLLWSLLDSFTAATRRLIKSLFRQ